MMKQTGLFGGLAQIFHNQEKSLRKTFGKKEKRKVPKDCCPSCFYALEKDCICGCGGLHHGEGAGLQKLNDYDILDGLKRAREQR